MLAENTKDNFFINALSGVDDPIEIEFNQENNDPSLNDPIKQYGQTVIENRELNKRIHCLTIIGQVEGHVNLPQQNKTTKYEHLLPQLAAIEEDDGINGILILINTVGGDVEAGLAIAEMIASLSKPTVSLVLGGGHSIGVPLAVCSNYSYIVPSATMTIHPIRMNGTVIGDHQTFDYLERMQERIINFVTHNSKITHDRLRELMLNRNQLSKDVGTIIVGKEAVDLGIIDEVGGAKEAIRKIYEIIEENNKQNQEQMSERQKEGQQPIGQQQSVEQQVGQQQVEQQKDGQPAGQQEGQSVGQQQGGQLPISQQPFGQQP